MKIEVYGVKWDGTIELSKNVSINIDDDIIEDRNDEEEMDMLISDELSNEFGFCHFGWENHKII